MVHPLAWRVVRRHLGEPSAIEASIEHAVDRQTELLEVLLAAAHEIDWLRHEAHAALDAQPDPKKTLARVGARRRAVLAAESDADVRLRDVANQARALVTRIRLDTDVEWRDVVRALEGIVEAAGVDE